MIKQIISFKTITLKTIHPQIRYKQRPFHRSVQGEFLSIYDQCAHQRLHPDQRTMKLPKETKRYCPYCKKHTLQSVGTAKQKSRSAAHPLSRGSSIRAKARGLKSGTGNKGKWGSKPAVKLWKRKTKTTKRITVQYTCKTCKKTKQIKKAIRAGRIEVGQSVTK